MWVDEKMRWTFWFQSVDSSCFSDRRALPLEGLWLVSQKKVRTFWCFLGSVIWIAIRAIPVNSCLGVFDVAIWFLRTRTVFDFHENVYFHSQNFQLFFLVVRTSCLNSCSVFSLRSLIKWVFRYWVLARFYQKQSLIWKYPSKFRYSECDFFLQREKFYRSVGKF